MTLNPSLHSVLLMCLGVKELDLLHVIFSGIRLRLCFARGLSEDSIYASLHFSRNMPDYTILNKLVAFNVICSKISHKHLNKIYLFIVKILYFEENATFTLGMFKY